MSEWKKVKLGDLTSVITKGTSPSNIGESFTNKGIRYIRSEMITQNKYISEHGSLYISKETHDKLKRSQLKAGDILFSMAGIYLGKTAILRECDVPANTNQAVAIIRLNGDLCNKEYLYYFLNQEEVVRYVNQISGQAAQPNINLKQISNIEIDIPNKNIQYCIATILSRYDSLIENYQKQIKLLEESAQRLYKEWFIDLRFPGHENTKIVDGVPEGWEKKRLADIAELKAGGDKPDIVSDVRTEDCAIPIFSNGTTNEGLYGFTKVPEIMEHCVTISARGSVGYTVLRRTPFVPIVRLISVIPHNVYVGYIFYYLKSTTLDSNGAAQQQITIPMIRNKEITIPSKGILEIFESQTEPIFNQIDILKDQIRHLTEARDRLLPKLMSGEIEV